MQVTAALLFAGFCFMDLKNPGRRAPAGIFYNAVINLFYIYYRG